MSTKRYTDEDLAKAVEDSFSYRNVLRLLGIKLAGGSQSHIKRRIEKLGLDVSHFTGQGHNRGKRSNNRMSADQTLIFDADRTTRQSYKRLHRSLQEIGREYRCEICSNDGIWMGDKITLQIDHIDGDWKNNLRENLRYLCPNCHWQTSTHGNKERA